MKTIDSTPNSPAPEILQPIAWIGFDWGDKEHAFVVQDQAGHQERGKMEHSAENLHAWLTELCKRFGGRQVSIGIEASRGAVIHVLLQYPWLTVYPINPITSARYRTAFRPSGAKDDLPDAEVLLDLVRHHSGKLRELERRDPLIAKLAGLVEARRKIVDQRTAVVNELTSLLKSYYPQALQLIGDLDSELAIDFLRRWPDLISLKATRPATIKRFYYQHQLRSETLVDERLALIAQARALTTEDALVSVALLKLQFLVDHLEVFRKHVASFDVQIKTAFGAHPHAAFFRELPGAGAQLAPRLCVAFAASYPDPASMQKFTGLAPVREKSGNQIWTHWRWQAPRFLRQTFVEWAGQTVRYSQWANAYYENMLKKGKKHAAIIRSLAFKWIRILWKCWQTKTLYSEARYLKQLIKRKSRHAIQP